MSFWKGGLGRRARASVKQKFLTQAETGEGDEGWEKCHAPSQQKQVYTHTMKMFMGYYKEN